MSNFARLAFSVLVVTALFLASGCGAEESVTDAVETPTAEATTAAASEPSPVPTTTPTPPAADATPLPVVSREDSMQFLIDGGLNEEQAACITDGSFDLTGSWDLRLDVSSSMEQELSAMAFACIQVDAPPTAEPIQDLSVWMSDAGSLTPAERVGLYAGSPPNVLADGGSYEAIITTPDGDMTFELFATEAPITVNSFLNLASDGYYDNVTFHRVIDDFMAQGGDPSGSGSGGPGYQFVNEYTAGIEFDQRGRLAMANAGRDTNGSQFFITYAPLGLLASDYTIFGQLTEGDETLAAIEMRDPGTATEPGTEIVSIQVNEVR